VAVHLPIKLKVDRKFRPCLAEDGDELYPNGIFEFNITRLLSFIEVHPEQFPVQLVPLTTIPDYGSRHLDEETIRAADLSRPILLAEIAPGCFNVIDGHHRVARARKEAVSDLPARTIHSPHHVPFLTSIEAYEKYVEYWNSKLKDAGKRILGYQ
jgi:hypothetical protein